MSAMVRATPQRAHDGAPARCDARPPRLSKNAASTADRRHARTSAEGDAPSPTPAGSFVPASSPSRARRHARERAGAQHPLAQRGRTTCRRPVPITSRGEAALHVQVQVDAVHERAADAPLVRPHLRHRARAGALAGRRSSRTGQGFAAATSMNRAGNVTLPSARVMHDPARLQGLAQALQHRGLELGQLVQEQHPVVGKRYLARPRRARRRRRARPGWRDVVRAAERPVARQNRPPCSSPATEWHERRLQGLVLLQRAAGWTAGARRAWSCPNPAGRVMSTP